MFDILKKSLLAGLGAAVVSREMVVNATSRLVKEGRLSTEEAYRLADELIESGRQSWQDVEKEAKDAMGGAVESMGIARSQELNELKVRVVNLEQQVNILFSQLSQAEAPSEPEEGEAQ